MQILIGNTVKTARSDYSFPTREQAEAFYLTLRSRTPTPSGIQPGQRAARRPAAKPRPGGGT